MLSRLRSRVLFIATGHAHGLINTSDMQITETTTARLNETTFIFGGCRSFYTFGNRRSWKRCTNKFDNRFTSKLFTSELRYCLKLRARLYKGFKVKQITSIFSNVKIIIIIHLKNVFPVCKVFISELDYCSKFHTRLRACFKIKLNAFTFSNVKIIINNNISQKCFSCL